MAKAARPTLGALFVSSSFVSLAAAQGLEIAGGWRPRPASWEDFGWNLLSESLKFSVGAKLARDRFRSLSLRLEHQAHNRHAGFPKVIGGEIFHPLGGRFIEIGGATPGLMTRFTSKAFRKRRLGQVLLISGAGSNHTSFGAIPARLADRSWRVKMLVYPGYQDPSDAGRLEGGGLQSRRLAKDWQQSMREALRAQVEKHEEGPLLLGGFSMGAAGIFDAYHSLTPALRRKVDGLILAAPAVYPKAFDGPHPALNFATRYLALPLLSFLGLNSKKKESGVHPQTSRHVEVAMEIPRSANHASVLTIERGRRAAERLSKEEALPPILLIHSGDHDPTISGRSATQIKEWFGSSLRREVLIPREDGHYVLVGANRAKAEDAVLEFAERRALAKMPIPSPRSTRWN